MIQGEFDFDEHLVVQQPSPIWEFSLDGRKISTMILGGRLANAHCSGAGGRWHALVRGKRPEAALWCKARPQVDGLVPASGRASARATPLFWPVTANPCSLPRG
jgi:hypothetical protein